MNYTDKEPKNSMIDTSWSQTFLPWKNVSELHNPLHLDVITKCGAKRFTTLATSGPKKANPIEVTGTQLARPIRREYSERLFDRKKI